MESRSGKGPLNQHRQNPPRKVFSKYATPRPILGPSKITKKTKQAESPGPSPPQNKRYIWVSNTSSPQSLDDLELFHDRGLLADGSRLSDFTSLPYPSPSQSAEPAYSNTLESDPGSSNMPIREAIHQNRPEGHTASNYENGFTLLNLHQDSSSTQAEPPQRHRSSSADDVGNEQEGTGNGENEGGDRGGEGQHGQAGETKEPRRNGYFLAALLLPLGPGEQPAAWQAVQAVINEMAI